MYHLTIGKKWNIIKDIVTINRQFYYLTVATQTKEGRKTYETAGFCKNHGGKFGKKHLPW